MSAYTDYVADIRANNVIHSPGVNTTPCGITYWVPDADGVLVTAVGSSYNRDLVNCPECEQAVTR